MMVEVTKQLQERYQALKWAYEQGKSGFTYRDIREKYPSTLTFLTAAAKKNLIKTSGPGGTMYIGPEPTIKLAFEVYDFEKQMYKKSIAKLPKKTIEIEGLDKFKGVVEKAINSQVPMKEDSPIVQQRKPPYSFSVDIQEGMVTMKWSDFSRLMNK